MTHRPVSLHQVSYLGLCICHPAPCPHTHTHTHSLRVPSPRDAESRLPLLHTPLLGTEPVWRLHSPISSHCTALVWWDRVCWLRVPGDEVRCVMKCYSTRYFHGLCWSPWQNRPLLQLTVFWMVNNINLWWHCRPLMIDSVHLLFKINAGLVLKAWMLQVLKRPLNAYLTLICLLWYSE